MRPQNKPEDKAISILKQKVKKATFTGVTENGLFDGICPAGYNWLTGYVDWKGDMNFKGRLDPAFTPISVNNLFYD